MDSGFYSGQSGKVKTCLTTGLFYDRYHRSRVGPGAFGLGGPGSQQLELFVFFNFISMFVVLVLFVWLFVCLLCLFFFVVLLFVCFFE